ncbi:antigen peptide transporter 2-like isoform X1 [Pseudopipra pipra]|uniref:antigen peptide transporter 2-like isoform X1 n=1 Tax=Pseudopipra pipra TaxID=415032 RepID=UPI003139E58A
MALPPATLLPGVLLVADALALVLLGPLVPALAPMGVAGMWLEAALRLPFLATAPRLLTPHRPPGATAAAVAAAATPAVFGTLRSLLGPPGARPGLLAAAAPAWLGVTHAATALALLAWATPLMPGSVPEASPGVPKTLGCVPKAPAAFRRVLALAWSEWKVLGAAFLCLMLAATGETAGPYVTGKVLDAIRNRDGLTAGAVGMVVAAEAASVLFSGCRGWLFLLAAARLRQSLRLQLFSHLVHQDLDFFQGMPAAELSARFSTEVPLVSMAVPRGTNLLLRSLGMALVVGMAMVWLAPGLALLALLELPLGITTRRIHSARKQALQRSMLEASARTASEVQESIAAIETIQIFSAEEEEEERHSQNLDKELRLKEQMELELAGFTLIHRVLRLAIRVLVLFRSHQQLRDGSITPGVLVTFLLYRDTVGSHVQVLLIGFNEFMTNMAAGQKIWEYLDQEPTRDTGGTLEPSKLRGDITFQRVCFTYPGHPERPVLKDVSFEVRSGEVTALAGPNGSGKSTAVALLERLRDPGSGKVLLDGIPLQEYEHQYLHRQVEKAGRLGTPGAGWRQWDRWCWWSRILSCFPERSVRMLCWGWSAVRSRSCGRRPLLPEPWSSSRGWNKAGTPRWGSLGGGWRRGSGVAWPWPGPCSGVRLSSFSTRRWMTETRGRRSAGCALGSPGPCWSSPTGRGCWKQPIASWCWSVGPWQRQEHRRSCGNATGPTAACSRAEVGPGSPTPREREAGNKGKLVSPFLVFVSHPCF